MITVLIGHRGVGKTTLLEKIAQGTSLRVVDLDQAIEEARGESVASLFSSGEANFRKIENKVFQNLVERVDEPTVIAVGAGFQGELPTDARVVWVRRATDGDGRIFLNRPRLTSLASPLDEYLVLFVEREARYRAMATEVLQIPEGDCSNLEDFFAESKSVGFKPGSLNCDQTLFPHQLNLKFIERRLAWGVRRFELRMDILNEEQLQWAFTHLPAENILFSVRSSEHSSGTTAPVVLPHQVLEFVSKQKLAIDWPVEMGEPPFKVDIISCHSPDLDLSNLNFSRAANSETAILKLAPEIKTFQQLLDGHRWWLENPKHRAFLPRSQNGRWQWYRSLYGPSMPIHFIREDEGSSLDQPFLWQALLQPTDCIPKKNGVPFAAVLGSPVQHSRTPMEHLEFFKQRGIAVVAVEISESEWPEAMPVLQELGLRFAAVTAPLKNLAGGNTLAWQNGKCFVTNTDVLGIETFKNHIETNQSVALWGGGGTVPAVKSVFPDIKKISARQGAKGMAAPDVLIWAVGRNREFQWPPADWQLQKILDLNYTENSPGLELAATRRIPYVSGLEMFRAQAQGQREFWRGFL